MGQYPADIRIFLHCPGQNKIERGPGGIAQEFHEKTGYVQAQAFAGLVDIRMDENNRAALVEFGHQLIETRVAEKLPVSAPQQYNSISVKGIKGKNRFSAGRLGERHRQDRERPKPTWMIQDHPGRELIAVSGKGSGLANSVTKVDTRSRKAANGGLDTVGVHDVYGGFRWPGRKGRAGNMGQAIGRHGASEGRGNQVMVDVDPSMMKVHITSILRQVKDVV